MDGRVSIYRCLALAVALVSAVGPRGALPCHCEASLVSSVVEQETTSTSYNCHCDCRHRADSVCSVPVFSALDDQETPASRPCVCQLRELPSLSPRPMGSAQDPCFAVPVAIYSIASHDRLVLALPEPAGFPDTALTRCAILCRFSI